MIAPGLISLLLVLVTSALLIASGLRKQPGIGIFASVAVIGLALWLRGEGLRTLGFGPPPSWIAAALLGLILGVLIALSGFNLWLAIFTHGFIDTAGIVLIALGWDKAIHARVEGVRR